MHSFNVPDRDTRDPHFVDFNGRLFVYSGTWYGGDLRPKIRNMNQMLGYGVSTSDGERWSMPFQLNGTYGHYVWRGATYNNAVYLCARRRTGFKELPDLTNHAAIVQSRILRSDDGISFTDVGHFQTQNGDETAFHFTENGVIQAIARRGNRSAELIILKPPYNTPIRTDLGRYIGGPLLFKYQDYMLVAGRNRSEGKVHTNISILKEEKLIDLINLPSGGDCSYPGMVTLCPGCLLVSWYSSHLKDDDGKAKTCIFTAKLHIN
ncbi:MAG: hypothetical protein CMJ76_11235 [Planctomycetaceae bacterium]|nr:hypothetical protein [Planctomycetaceae bacterium]